MGSPSASPPKSGNNTPLISDNHAPNPRLLLNFKPHAPTLADMTRIRFTCLLLAALLAPAVPLPALARDCYADYKAKQDDPLKLHYGVARITGECSKGAAQAQLAGRLQSQGWTLLNVVSVFGPDGLDKRKANAGAYYLRY